MLHINKFEFSPIRENTYIIHADSKDCIIIDPGCYFEEERSQLSQFIEQMQLNPMMLLNTHGHLDHVFGNKYVAEKYQLTPHIHPLERATLEYAPTSGLLYNMPFDHYSGPLADVLTGQIIEIGGDKLKVLFTPGHSPGSISLYCAEQSFVISGDVLFKNSVGRTDLPGGDFDVLIQSIRNELLVLPENTLVYSGHGETTTIGQEKMNNPYL